MATDTDPITGCPFMMGTNPHPCVTIQANAPAQRVQISGNPFLLQTSVGLCKSPEGVSPGTVMVTGVQTRVKGV